MECFKLPDGSITKDSILAAELWAKAFYQAKDALERIRNVSENILRKQRVSCLEEILGECDQVLSIGGDRSISKILI